MSAGGIDTKNPSQSIAFVRGFVRSMADWVAISDAGRALHLLPSAWVEANVATPHLNAKLLSLSRYLTPPAQVFAIKGGYVLGDEGAVATPDRELILSTISRPSVAAVDHPTWKLRDNGANIAKFDGVAAAVTHHGPRSFSHVVADCLPRIWLVRQAGFEPDAWIVPTPDEGWHDDLLTLAGIAPSKRIYARADSAISVGTLILPDASGFALGISRWARTAVLEYVGQDFNTSSASRRIWISRNQAKRRRWQFESSLNDDLDRRGFEVLTPETATIREQAHSASMAEVIAGPHGGGLCWALASRKNSGLLFEVASPTLVHNDYQALAAVCGWKYDRTTAIDGFGANENKWHDDITLEPELVLRSLDAALSSFQRAEA